MKKVILILAVLLLAVYCYAQVNTAEGTDNAIVYNTKEHPVADDADVDSEGDASQHKEIHDTRVEDAHDYNWGTGEREVLVPDYGTGDMGEEAAEQ